MIITSIDRKGKDIYDIFIDNAYSFSVSEEDYLKFSLYDKKEISSDELNKLKQSSNFTMAKTKALVYLSYKIRTSKEIQEKLLKEGFNQNAIEQVIKELSSQGYINDMLYVRKFIYDRNKLNPKSMRMLTFELKNKGIDDDLIAQGLNELKLDNILIARGLILKKYKDNDLCDPKVKRKIFLFLKYRGFNDSEIKKAINEIIEDKEDFNY